MSLRSGLYWWAEGWTGKLMWNHATTVVTLTVVVPLVALILGWTPWWVRFLAGYGAISMALFALAAFLDWLDEALRARRERISWWGR